MGTTYQHAEALDEQDECKLWESGMLNVDIPIGLFNCACTYFYNGKKFCLRGGEEH